MRSFNGIVGRIKLIVLLFVEMLGCWVVNGKVVVFGVNSGFVMMGGYLLC